jgi:hypothetical protein
VLSLLVPLTASPDPDVAVNAAAAMGRVAGRSRGDAATAALCALLASKGPLVQANALTGLALGHARCGDGARERTLLTATSDEVREAAARAVGAKQGSPDDGLALAQCASADRVGEVAAICRRMLATVTPAPGSGPASGPPMPHPVEVYVEAGTETEPHPLAPYVVEVADGMLRLGTTDRRGAFFDPAAPDGELRLHTLHTTGPAAGLAPGYSPR